MAQTYTRGVLLWIDDAFGDQLLAADASPDAAATQKWQELFGGASDRLFRLMDLSLEVACNHEEAIAAIRRCGDPRAAGAFVFTVLDLSIPRGDSPPAVKHGIEVAEELRRAELPFVFLSAKTDATAALDEAGLGTVPYYVKEPSGGAWRLPEALAQNVLSEFCRKTSWVSLADVVAVMHPDSDVVRTHAESPEAFEHFPFFGPYADFVERWEYKDRLELPGAFVVTATVEHSDQFVQQALSLLLYQRLIRHPGSVRMRYGQAHDGGYLRQLRTPEAMQDPDGVCVVRIWPAETTVEELAELLHDACRREGTTIYVVPNDEWADKYAELFRQAHVPTIEEVPQTQWGDAAAREELIKRTCALVFQRWSQPSREGEAMPLPLGYLAHPELLINPVDWIALHEAQAVARELSDPYEITHELSLAIRKMSARHAKEFRQAIARELPLAYRRLLRVGHETLRRSRFAGELPVWIERAVDVWLNTSWHFPYGLGKQFAQLQHAQNDEEAWRGRNWEAWEDGCYEILAGILDEYGKQCAAASPPTARQADLARVLRFVEHLGGARFLRAPPADVDWESLESFRWPHHRYPMPAAVNRRLKEAKRYLWIQPEGLDTALALPYGRLRYRFLTDVVEQYSSVLQWGETVAPRLPLGWQSSVAELVHVIRNHRVAEAWRGRAGRQAVWNALLGLLRNAAPVMLIVDWTLRRKPLTGLEGKESVEKFLKTSKGSGTILGRLRSPRAARRHGCLATAWEPAGVGRYLHALERVFSLLAGAPAEMGPEAHALATRLSGEIAGLASHGENESDARQNAGGPPVPSSLASAVGAFLTDGKSGALDAVEPWLRRPSRETLEACPAAALESLFKTKADYLWHVLEELAVLGHLTYPYRYFDGYHLLATLNDLRVAHKDAVPREEDLAVAQVETVLDLFLASLEGLVAQLAWCLETAGKPTRARAITPPNVWVRPPEGFTPPSPEDFSQILRVVAVSDQYAVGTFGSPVPGKSNRLAYHEGGEAVPVDDRPELVEQDYA
ncbi:MAG: hypothetical protein ACYTG0_04090 [Planctomycetota bacterium]|jgi:hypothetical protein